LRKLLVPFDGSDNALRALHYAASIAREHPPIAIHVVTVHDKPEEYGYMEVYVPREKLADLQRQSSQARLAVAEEILEQAAVPYEAEILIGHTAEAIARRADELGCDSIVMGTRGMTAIGGLVMGSIATKVVHAAHVPVTLVK
jgi:nucleotide-binding universal stress UspA family protein